MVGERTTGFVFGEAIRGTTIISIIRFFRETGEPGIIRAIGIDHSTENLRTIMMEGLTEVVSLTGAIVEGRDH